MASNSPAKGSSLSLSPRSKIELQAKTLQTLVSTGAVMVNGHFDFGSHHGSVYINPHQIFRQPYVMMEFSQGLLDLIGSDTLNKVQVSTGPERGGARMGLVNAFLVHSLQPIGSPHVEFAEIQGNDDNELFLPEACQRIVAGKNVIVFDDIRNTGSTLYRGVNLLRQHKANVIATAVWFDRLNLQPEFELDLPHYSLAEYDGEDIIFPADKCNLCTAGIQITRFR